MKTVSSDIMQAIRLLVDEKPEKFAEVISTDSQLIESFGEKTGAILKEIIRLCDKRISAMGYVQKKPEDACSRFSLMYTIDGEEFAIELKGSNFNSKCTTCCMETSIEGEFLEILEEVCISAPIPRCGSCVGDSDLPESKYFPVSE